MATAKGFRAVEFRLTLSMCRSFRSPVMRLLVTGILTAIFLIVAVEAFAAIGMEMPAGWPTALVAGVCGALSYWFAHSFPALRPR